jgi:heme exporter protein D
MGAQIGDGVMSFNSLAEFIDMGGHGPFVWGAYAIAFVVVVFNFIWPIVMVRRNKARLRKELSASAVQEQT